MGKHYSEEFKNEVINAYKSGKYGGYRQVAKMYNIKIYFCRGIDYTILDKQKCL